MSEKLYKASDVIGILLEEITNAEFLRVAKRLSDIPSAVVRCKDCKHWKQMASLPKQYGECLESCFGTVYPRGDFFCADGERRIEE